MNIQDEAMKIHSQYGTSEMANYKLQLLAEQYAKEYHESEVKKLDISLVSGCFTETDVERAYDDGYQTEGEVTFDINNYR